MIRTRWRCGLTLMLVVYASTPPVARSGVWGDTWGAFVWGLDLLSVPTGLTLYAPTAELAGEVAGCFDLLVHLGGADKVESITAVVPASQQAAECAYQDSLPSGDDFSLELGAAYLVRLKQSHELSAGPPPGCPATELDDGINLIAVGKPTVGLTCFDVITAYGSDSVSAMQRLNTERGAYESCVFDGDSAVGNDFPVMAGEGYIVHAIGTALPVNFNDLNHPVCNER